VSNGSRGARGLARRAQPLEALQADPTLDLIKAQSQAGHKLRGMAEELSEKEFKGAKGGVQVVMDGMQRIKSVTIGEAEGDVSAAVLAALQGAYDASTSGTQDDVWNLYKENSVLAQAPLSQLGAGSTAEDLWANVTQTEESMQLATELFFRFDMDKDGFWNMNETSEVQMATEGTGMREEDFKSLIIAAAPDGGRTLTEEDLQRGLSKEQVIQLYTDREKQRQLGFVLNIYNDHAKVFAADAAAAEAAAAAEEAPAAEEAAAAEEAPAAEEPAKEVKASTMPPEID
jgi:DNA-binding protein YbaB